MTFDIMRGEMIISPLIIIVDRGEMAISPLMIFLSIDFDITWQINYIFLPRLFISGLLGNVFFPLSQMTKWQESQRKINYL